MQITTRAGLVAQAAFHASGVAVIVVSSPACPRHLLQEDLVDAVCHLLRAQVLANLLAFCDAPARRDSRADWETLDVTLRSVSLPPLLTVRSAEKKRV
jgi:hypothetical protein